MRSPAYWKQPEKWNRAAKRDGVRRRVFCASVADIFEDRPDLIEPRARLFRLIEESDALDWLLLTKRPQNMLRLASAWGNEWPSNVWAGTTVEDQRRAAERIPHLLMVPAAVRFLSCEPLLEPLDLDPPTCPSCGEHDVATPSSEDGTPFCPECEREMAYGAWLDPCADLDQQGINWVIVGSESGAGARPMQIEWARRIVDDCIAASVPVFTKQIANDLDRKGGDPIHWPAGVWPREFPHGS
jgi:protein gp37